jgi:hypothetical protein
VWGLLPLHVFKLLVLAADSIMQINQSTESSSHNRRLLRCDFRKKLKMSIFDRVMKSTNTSLCAFIAPQAKERCICSWTRYANLLVWFDNIKVFLIEFGFAVVGCNEGPVFDEKTMHQILNLDAMDISIDGSKTIEGGRPEVSFYDPHLPMPSLTSAKSLHSSLAFLEVTPQDSVCLCTGSYC